MTEITRDVLGRATEMRRGEGISLANPVVRSYAHDLHGRLCQTNEPETGSTVLQYDAAGNVSWSAAGLNLILPTPEDCDANRTSAYGSGRRVDRTYDALNRLLTLAFPDGVGNQTWTYTPDGLPLTIRTYNNGTGGEIVDNAYVYNHRRLLTGETSAQPGAYSWSVGYGYDANGSLASMVYPSGLSVAYAPNALGQPTQAGTFATGVEYFPNGAVKRFTYDNDVVHTMEQNIRLLPARSTDSGGVLDLTYEYDENGNTTFIDNHRVANNTEDRTMVYDALDRLTSAESAIVGGDHVHRFTYDVQDNLRSWLLAGVKDYASYEYTNNQLTAIKSSTNAVVDAFSYDPQGNLDERHLNLPGEQDFSFDFGNRNRGINGLEGFRYDGHGRRVSTWLPAQGKARFYMYGRTGQLFFEGSETQGINSEFVYLGDDLVAAKELVLGGGGWRTRYKHNDALGSPVATTDEAGIVVDRTNYEPFGKTIGENLDGVGYTGHVMDPQSSLVYMEQRYYDPANGRFLSVDPIGAEDQSGSNFNRYAYANNSPMMFVDPDGRLACPKGIGAGCIQDKGSEVSGESGALPSADDLKRDSQARNAQAAGRTSDGVSLDLDAPTDVEQGVRVSTDATISNPMEPRCWSCSDGTSGSSGRYNVAALEDGEAVGHAHPGLISGLPGRGDAGLAGETGHNYVISRRGVFVVEKTNGNYRIRQVSGAKLERGERQTLRALVRGWNQNSGASNGGGTSCSSRSCDL